MSLHLVDPAIRAKPGLDFGAWRGLEDLAILYRGIHRARRSDFAESRKALTWAQNRQTPSDPLVSSVLAELQALHIRLSKGISEVMEPLEAAIDLLQCESVFRPRIVELAALRAEIASERGEVVLLKNSRRWLESLVEDVDLTLFPQLAQRIERLLSDHSGTSAHVHSVVCGPK
jgi:hypothetical protein